MVRRASFQVHSVQFEQFRLKVAQEDLILVTDYRKGNPWIQTTYLTKQYVTVAAVNGCFMGTKLAYFVSLTTRAGIGTGTSLNYSNRQHLPNHTFYFLFLIIGVAITTYINRRSTFLKSDCMLNVSSRGHSNKFLKDLMETMLEMVKKSWIFLNRCYMDFWVSQFHHVPFTLAFDFPLYRP